MKIRIRVLELGLVTFIAVLSWFVMFCLECYYFGADKELQKVHSKGNQPPFPDHLADNVFWLLQVRLHACTTYTIVLTVFCCCFVFVFVFVFLFLFLFFFVFFLFFGVLDY